jgi:hypothetical protein
MSDIGNTISNHVLPSNIHTRIYDQQGSIGPENLRTFTVIDRYFKKSISDA